MVMPCQVYPEYTKIFSKDEFGQYLTHYIAMKFGSCWYLYTLNSNKVWTISYLVAKNERAAPKVIKMFSLLKTTTFTKSTQLCPVISGNLLVLYKNYGVITDYTRYTTSHRKSHL